MALHQLRTGRHFISEHPQGSELYQLPAWELVSNDVRLRWLVVHMCVAGLVDPENGIPVFKASEIWASDDLLLDLLRDLKCDGGHDHSTLQGSFAGVPKTLHAQTWTWDFASRVASGVAAVTRRHYKQRQAHHLTFLDTYASSSTTPESSTSEDRWEETENQWIRIINVPRQQLFHPADATSGPSLSAIKWC